jgi:Na+/melibiose symporter-like transporter
LRGPRGSKPDALTKSKRRKQKGASLSVLIGILITFLVIILVLYLINMLPLDGRAKQIARVVVIIIGIISLLKYLAVF